MQIRELVGLAKYLKAMLSETGLPNLYQELINAINQASQNQEPHQVEQALSQLIAAHEKAEQFVASPAQARLLQDYGGDKLLGKAAIDRINEILAKNQAHPQGLVQGFKGMMAETNQMNKQAGELINVVEPLFHILEDVDTDLDENEGRLWLYFSEDVQIVSINDLEDAAETWKQILHNFSRLPDATSEGARILQIQKRSPVELEVAATIALLTPLAFGINWVLNRIQHVIQILQEVEKLKQLKVKTKIIQDLRKDAETEKKKIAEEAAAAIKDQFGGDNETKNATKQALSKIIKFVEGGGQLDIDVGDEPEGEDEDDEEGANEERANMRQLIQNIRKELKELPALPQEKEENGEEGGNENENESG